MECDFMEPHLINSHQVNFVCGGGGICLFAGRRQD